MQHFIVYYNNAIRIVHSLSMRCSVILIFHSSCIYCCNSKFRICMHSQMHRISASTNNIVQSIEYSDVYNTSLFVCTWLFHFIVIMDIMHIACMLCQK